MTRASTPATLSLANATRRDDVDNLRAKFIMLRYLLLAILVVVLAFVGDLVYRLNVFTTFETLNEEYCSLVRADRASGLEDGDVLGNVVLFSADGTRRSWLMTGDKGASMKAAGGDLFAYVDGALTKVKRSQEPSEFEFHPHGIGLLATNVGATTRTRLFVVNHRVMGEEVSNILFVGFIWGGFFFSF